MQWNGCFFEQLHPRCLPYICAAQEREDGKNIQFKEISKTMITREKAKELLPILQAFAEGKTIQFKTKDRPWFDLLDNDLEMRGVFKYRIKPEPKYRPFKSQEECWEEMHKHPDFGWVVTKNCRVMYHIDSIHNALLIGYIGYSFDEMYQKFEFLDGTQFGIKEEE